MTDLNEAIAEIETKLKQGDDFSLKLSEAHDTIKNIKSEYASLNNENMSLKQDLHTLLKELYKNYDDRELLLSSNGNF